MNRQCDGQRARVALVGRGCSAAELAVIRVARAVAAAVARPFLVSLQKHRAAAGRSSEQRRFRRSEERYSYTLGQLCSDITSMVAQKISSRDGGQ